MLRGLREQEAVGARRVGSVSVDGGGQARGEKGSQEPRAQARSRRRQGAWKLNAQN